MIYDYECPKCKAIEEVMCAYNTKEKFVCPYCDNGKGKPVMKRILSPVSFVLQGKGFYGRGRI